MYQQSSITLRCIVNAYILKFQKWNHSHKVANSQSRSDRFLRWPGEQNPWTPRWRRYSWSWTGLELTEFRCSLTETFHSIVSLKRKRFLTEFRALPALVVLAVPSTVIDRDRFVDILWRHGRFVRISIRFLAEFRRDPGAARTESSQFSQLRASNE